MAGAHRGALEEMTFYSRDNRDASGAFRRVAVKFRYLLNDSDQAGHRNSE
jgi:hypothetical protein